MTTTTETVANQARSPVLASRSARRLAQAGEADNGEAAARRTAMAYIRVSTDEQETQRQADTIRRHCQIEGIELLDIIQESSAASGRPSAVRRSPSDAIFYYRSLLDDNWQELERPGYAEFLSRVLADPPTYAIFYALDRLSRDATELLLIRRVLQEVDCEIIALNQGGALDTSTAAGWLQFAIQAVLAEHECHQVSERTRATLKTKANDPAIHIGRPPVGWRKRDGAYEHDPVAWPRVEAAAQLRQEGAKYHEIARELAISVSSVKPYLDAHTWTPPLPQALDSRSNV